MKKKLTLAYPLHKQAGFTLIELTIVLLLSGVLLTVILSAIMMFQTFYQKAEQSIELNDNLIRESSIVSYYLSYTKFTGALLTHKSHVYQNNLSFINDPSVLGVDIFQSAIPAGELHLKRSYQKRGEVIVVHKIGREYVLLKNNTDNVELTVSSLEPRFKKRNELIISNGLIDERALIKDVRLNYAKNEQVIKLQSPLNKAFNQGAMLYPLESFTLYSAKNAQDIFSLYQKPKDQQNKMLLSHVDQLHFNIKGALLSIKSRSCFGKLCKSTHLLLPL